MTINALQSPDLYKMVISPNMILAVAALLALSCFSGSCRGSSHSLLPHFNCKKVAFYKTHKTGSTTLGGVLFRIAVSSNMSVYTTLHSHYVSVGFKENPQLLGRSDMVLRHIRFSDSPGFHAATRSFYGRALGTAEYGFLTILRHPVDRYISDFFYYVEPDTRRGQRQISLRQYAAAAEGANRMSAEFAVRTQAEAVEFAAGEMQTDGVFLPLELLDYGLALLATHCGWRLSQLLYLPVNSNTDGAQRYGNVTLSARPTMTQLSEQDPALMDRIAAVNDIDAVLYGAAMSQLMARLQPFGPTAAAATASAVMAAAVRLTAARKSLEAECRALRTTRVAEQATGAAAATPPPPLALRGNISANDLAGLCAWYALPDSVYERMPSPETGRVALDVSLPSPAPPPATSWPVGHLRLLADKHLALYDDPSVPYYHSLLAVRVRPPTAADAELVYGITGAGATGGSGGGDGPLAAAVRLWTLHHAREGLHHLVFFLDEGNGDGGGGEQEQERVVRQAAAAALGHPSVIIGARGGAAVESSESYTTFSIMRCNDSGSVDASGAAAGGGGGGGGCDAAATFRELVSRSRWSAVLPGLASFLYGTRGSVRSVLLSYEGLLQGAGAVCAPLVPWRTPPPGAAVGWSGGGGGGGGRRRRDGGGGGGDFGDQGQGLFTGIDSEREPADFSGGNEGGAMEGEGAARGAAQPAVGSVTELGAPASPASQTKNSSGTGRRSAAAGAGNMAARVEELSRENGMRSQGRALLEEQVSGVTTGGGGISGGGAHDGGGASASGGSGNISGGGGGGGQAACLRAPCSLGVKDPLRCVMIRGMPLLGRTRPYLSSGAPLPEGKPSYRVPYRGPEHHRLEVARLALPSAEETGLVAAARDFSGEGPPVLRCTRVPRPRLRVPWCNE
ncbi:Galactose-3-O-sulfotransferase 3 [Pleodorina starrii]|nr:Galactose-3-O-sulfotransferase 3 [Pleodorina starrii]